MATLTIADLDNGKRDLETVDAVANSQADTTPTRYGQQTLTLAGALRRLGWQAPVPYAPGLNVNSPMVTVERDGVVYRPDPALVPFTTGAWNPDQWLVVQNTEDSNQVYQFATLAEAQAAAAALPEGSTVIVDGDTQGQISGGAYVPDSGTPAVRLQGYAALRAYRGAASAVDLTAEGVAGRLYRSGAGADNGVTVIRDGLGRSWKRDYSEAAKLEWAEVATGGSAALQRAIDSGLPLFEADPSTVINLTTPVNVARSNLTIRGNGATIRQQTVNTDGIRVAFDGTAFTPANFISITGFKLVGSDNGLTTNVGFGLSVHGVPGTTPYTETNGCQSLEFTRNEFSGWCAGISANGVNGLIVADNKFKGMKYHPAAGAGGYGLLTAGCVNVVHDRNEHTAEATDRHAVYISASPDKPNSATNVCRRVHVTNNIVDWSAVDGPTKFEACMMLRAPSDIVVTGNTLVGGYGGIDYDTLNWSSDNVVISNNTIRGVRTGPNSRAGIGFVRTGGTYEALGVSIKGNTITLKGALAQGIQPAYTQFADVAGNTIYSANNSGAIGLNVVNCANLTLGPNTIGMNNGGNGLVFDGTASQITVHRQTISGSNFFPIRAFTVPTGLRFAYVRRCTVTSNGSGSVTVTDAGGDDVAVSVASEANGFTLTLKNYLPTSSGSFSFSSASGSIGSMYHRASGANTITVGVQTPAGAPMPAASNAYSVTVFVAG